MANSTPDSYYMTKGLDVFCPIRKYGLPLKIVIMVLNILMSMSTIMGNKIIIAALQRVYSLHPPSKLLLQFLMGTNLSLGLLSQPLFVSFLMSQEHSVTCIYLKTLFYGTATLLGSGLILTLTAISVDRLLSLRLGLRYRQEVTIRRVRITLCFIWLLSAVMASTFIYYPFVTTSIAYITGFLCVITSTFCYIKIYLSLRQHHAQVNVLGQLRQGNVINIVRFRKMVTGVVWVHISLAVCYLPHTIVQAVFAFTGMNTASFDFIWDVTTSMAFLTSTLNPFLYCRKVCEVRQAVKDSIKPFFC